MCLGDEQVSTKAKPDIAAASRYLFVELVCAIARSAWQSESSVPELISRFEPASFEFNLPVVPLSVRSLSAAQSQQVTEIADLSAISVGVNLLVILKVSVECERSAVDCHCLNPPAKF